MSKISDFLSGTKILEEIDSPINGKIQVIQSLAWGRYVQVGGLTQSGGVVSDVWKTSLRKVAGLGIKVKNCLILGLAAGSNANLVKKFWANPEIKGVDIDKDMVEIGRKYFHLDEIGVEAIISDALKFCREAVKGKTKYDLILIDLYLGDQYPGIFEKVDFLKLIKKLLSPNGIAVFNRLYYGQKRKDAVKFNNSLEKVFAEVDVVYPQANIMFVCR